MTNKKTGRVISMKFNQSTIPFGMYCVKKDYLEFLKKKGQPVNPEQTLYCGPVLSKYNEKNKYTTTYFVPVKPESKDKFNCSTDALANGVVGDFDFRYMITCSTKELTATDDTHSKFVAENREMLEAYAEQVYNEKHKFAI